MERLSNQQSLLKPADKPSSQMEHLLKNFPAARITLSQSSTSLRDPSRFKSPPPLTLAGTSAGSQTTTSMSAYHFYPSPYSTATTTVAGFAQPTLTTTSAAAKAAASVEPVKAITSLPIEDLTKGFTEVERLVVPEKPEEPHQPVPAGADIGSSSSESSSSESSSESTQSENLSPQPPPIPPAPIMVPDILIHAEDDIHPKVDLSEEIENASEANLNLTSESGKDEFESCLENQDSGSKTDDQNFHTPGMSIDDSAVVETPKEELGLDSPLATSSPLTQTPRKEEIVVKVALSSLPLS